MVALTVRMELWSGSMFIGIRLFLRLLFLISFWDGGTVPKKTRHRIKGIPLSVWRVFFSVCCNVGPGEKRVTFSGAGRLISTLWA